MIAGFLICLALAATIGGTLFVCCAAVAGAHEDEMRREFAPLYRDQAGHEEWARTGLTDFEPGETPVFEQLCLERLDAELEAER